MVNEEQFNQFMIMARDLSLESVQEGGGPFGAVIVREGRIIGTGKNSVTGSHDPTAHAEINAIRETADNLETHNLSGCDIYCSSEPCPMCLGAIYWSRIDRLYYANSIEIAAKFGFDDSEIFKQFQLPTSGRRIPTIHLDVEEALIAFRYWENLENRQLY